MTRSKDLRSKVFLLQINILFIRAGKVLSISFRNYISLVGLSVVQSNVMPPRTTEVGRGFPTFRARNSIICRYGPGLVPSPRRKKDHTPVSCRQVQVHRRHGQELLPFP